VAINRRDYEGSSPLPADAFDNLTEDASAETFHQYFASRAKELSRFIVTFIQQEAIQGDIGLLGWSVSRSL
jgi:hypothetical protein